MKWELTLENKYGGDTILETFTGLPTVKQLVVCGLPRSTAQILLSPRSCWDRGGSKVNYWAYSTKQNKRYYLEQKI